jgi:hypothetical protein
VVCLPDSSFLFFFFDKSEPVTIHKKYFFSKERLERLFSFLFRNLLNELLGMNLNFGSGVLGTGVIYKHGSINHMWIDLRNYSSCARNKKLSFAMHKTYELQKSNNQPLKKVQIEWIKTVRNRMTLPQPW